MGHVQAYVKPVEVSGSLAFSRDKCWLRGASSVGDFVSLRCVIVFCDGIKHWFFW